MSFGDWWDTMKAGTASIPENWNKGVGAIGDSGPWKAFSAPKAAPDAGGTYQAYRSAENRSYTPPPAAPPPPPPAPLSDIDFYNKYQTKNTDPGPVLTLDAYYDAQRAATPQPATPQMDFATFADLYRRTHGTELDDAFAQRQMDRARGASGAQEGLFNSRETNLRGGYDISNRQADLKLAAQGIDRTQAGAELGNIGQQRALDAADLFNTLQGYQQNAKTALRKRESQAVASGAYMFPGQREDMRDTASNLANQSNAAQIGYQGKLLDLGAREQEIKTRQKKLDLISDEVGIDRDKASQALDYGLAQLGYDRYINKNQLLDMLDSTSTERRQAAQKITWDMIQAYIAFTGGAVGDQLQQMGGLPGNTGG